MESSSEVVYEEQTKSSVSKKCIQEVSATIQQVSTASALVQEKNLMSILGSDDNLIGNQVMAIANVESPITMPIITSPASPEDGNVVNTSSVQKEFSAMKLKDEQGNEIGEIVQEKQQQESVQSSSSVTAVGNSKSSSSVMQVSSSTSSSKVQQSATSVVAQAQESSSSVSCSSHSSTKKQEIVSSSTRSLSSIKSSQSVEKVMKSSIAVIEDQEF